MAESSKRAGDSTVSDEPTHKRAKTTFEPFSYDSTPDAITAENLARSIPELPSSTQSADLTQATIFYRNERKKFALLYKKWQSVKAFTLEDERFLRDNESVAPQVRLSFSKWEMATRAVTTFQDIFSMAVDKDSKLAWAAAHKVIDYVVICYMSAGGQLAHITRIFPELVTWFEAAVGYIEKSPSRATLHAFGEHSSNTSNTPAHATLQYAGSIYQSPPSTSSDIVHKASSQDQMPSPSNLGFTQPPPPSNLGQHNAFKGALTAGGQDVNTESLIFKIQACIMDTKKCLPWNEVHACPAIKKRLRVLFSNLGVKNTFARARRMQTNGLLFYGRPGTGKTILVKAMAQELGYTVYQLEPADINSKWQGDSEKFVKTLFEQAIANQPAMIFIDEIDTLTRHRVASDTASTYATKSTLLSLWSTLQHQGDRVVVVCITKNPSRIDPAFLARLTTKIWVRGPEAAERFAMAKSMLANVYHEVYLEPTPLTIQGTTSLYGLLTGAHKDHSISKLTGAEIANAIESATTAAWDELVETRAWVKITYKGEELLTPKTTAHHDGEVLTKSYADLTEDQLEKVAPRPMSNDDLEYAIKSIKPSEANMETELGMWDLAHGTDLSRSKTSLGLGNGFNY